jgi:uncharacterized protein (TIGR02001 family)
MALCAQSAMAQVSGSLALLSGYRFRGHSFNNSKATPQLTLNVDLDRGWYGGAMATQATVEETTSAQLIAYGGYARRLSGAWSGEVGVTGTAFTRVTAYDYAEAYVGVAGEQLSARLYYAPHYLGRPAQTLYGEVNGFVRVNQTWRLTGHVGLLHALSGDRSIGLPSGHHYDNRIGLAATVQAWSVQLARASRGARRYPGDTAPLPRALILSAAYSF